MKKLLAKSLCAIAFAASAATASASGLPFTVDTSADPTPGAGNTFVANEIAGTYVEGIALKAPGVFSASIVLDFTGFSGVPDAFSGLNIDYDLYAIVDVVGSFMPSALGGNLFDLGNFTGDIEVYADWDNDSNTDQVGAFNADGVTFAQNIAGDVEATIVGSGTDVLLGFTTDLTGGTNVGAGSSSFFVGSDTFELTAAGSSFFIEPQPFYDMVFSDGNISDLFSEVDFGSLATGQIQEFTSQADVTFVPSPTTTAILGLGILGLCLSRRAK
ncbi:flocculation-associated PEP-CTERM protein PepA [Glaciecola petra]|uniref:Flocculation-associated PEP-CTERM protein PepA n=1 Tax=Glaciecola petra TaxID=3075602 RepID=A0ABU2ZMN7_9ALTE|nr:flocculation-associated PEP-CTERM protein PepA [Aestuariibacter sp. P117]MDT0593619.1 flocculation-associated PEP-CTERM protein PepA [Aestuariibacter sp. P117]